RRAAGLARTHRERPERWRRAPGAVGGRGGRADPGPEMNSGATAEPFLWNVAGLLGESPGAERVDRIEGAAIDLGDDLRLAAPVDGRVRLVRTNRGILA